MQYVAIDIHKRYSVVSALNEQGQRSGEARIEGNSEVGFAQYFKAIGRSKVVMEASWNWGRIHDLLESIDEIEEVVLAHPYKTRVIAEAQVKTDKLDARSLAKLLRADLIAPAYIPGKETRRRKEVIRQRLFWVRMRTMVRNRVHQLIERQKDLSLPVCSDLFGVRGTKALKEAKLPEPDGTLLREDLELLDQLGQHIKELEKKIGQENQADWRSPLLETMPGMGKILSSVVATEIDEISRFRTPKKLLSYAGLVPTTHSSGGKTYNGPLMPMCNKWLRWAFVEAAWVAIGSSSYFGTLYQRSRARGKKSNQAIIIIARRMAEICWQMLSQRRTYEQRALNTFLDRSPKIMVEA
jgi:transposase